MSSRRVVLAAGGLALAAALTACGGHSDMTGTVSSGSAPASSAAASTGAAAGPSADGDAARAADVMFAQMMIPHHEQAVAMADLALDPAAGAGADVTALATRIKAAQAPEIATMNGWLGSWGAAVEDDDMGGMHHGASMPGMMSDEDMTALGEARGDAFDRMWLTMMVAHHEGALTMADDVLGTTQDPRVRTLAEAVVSGQTAEIATMKSLLAG